MQRVDTIHCLLQCIPRGRALSSTFPLSLSLSLSRSSLPFQFNDTHGLGTGLALTHRLFLTCRTLGRAYTSHLPLCQPCTSYLYSSTASPPRIHQTLPRKLPMSEEVVEKFKRIGFTDKQAKDTAGNKKIAPLLESIINQVSVPVLVIVVNASVPMVTTVKRRHGSRKTYQPVFFMSFAHT